ncbi:hypothetical protein KBD81_01765 [Candidatus Woesebacteria bacterium]|nr:hypothetical protein [Candidatus Woesebacteria bacterium]
MDNPKFPDPYARDSVGGILLEHAEFRAGNPAFEKIYVRMETELLWLAGQSGTNPRADHTNPETWKPRGVPSYLGEWFKEAINPRFIYNSNLNSDFLLTERTPHDAHKYLHSELLKRLYLAPKLKLDQDARVSINRNAEVNRAKWINEKGDPPSLYLQIEINDPHLTIAQEELLHGAMYMTSEVLKYPEKQSLIHEQTVQATHASTLMDRILTLAALEFGEEEYRYWYDRANDNRDNDRKMYRGNGRKSLMGLEINTRFLDPTITFAQIGLDLKNLEIYFENMHGYDGESEKRRFYTELISLGFGRFHKDWTYQMLDTVDTADGDFERIGKEIVECWGKPMLQIYKGTSQEPELLSHHSALSEPVGQEYFFYDMGDQFFKDFDNPDHANPSYLCSFAFINSTIQNAALKKVEAICAEWSKPPSILRSRQLQELLDGVGISWKDFLKMERNAQAEFQKSAMVTQSRGLSSSPGGYSQFLEIDLTMFDLDRETTFKNQPHSKITTVIPTSENS